MVQGRACTSIAVFAILLSVLPTMAPFLISPAIDILRISNQINCKPAGCTSFRILASLPFAVSLSLQWPAVHRLSLIAMGLMGASR